MHSAELEEDLLALIRSTNVPVAVFDEECRFTFVNEALAQLHGRSIPEHIGRSIATIDPERESFTSETVARVVATGERVTVATEHAGQPGFVVSYFRLRSRQNAARVGVMWVPTRVIEDTSSLWATAFETLLARTAARLLTAPSEMLDSEVVDSLRAICELQGFPWAAVVRFVEPGSSATITHAWHPPSCRESHAMQEEIASWASGMATEPSWSNYVSVAELPDRLAQARETLERLDVAGIAKFPIQLAGRLTGAVLMACTRTAQNSNSLSRLRLLSDLIAGAISRCENERAFATGLGRRGQSRDGLSAEPGNLEEEVDRLCSKAVVVHTSQAMRNVMELARTVAGTSATVLICGESGAGKELVARAIHQGSSRSNAPLVKVNCASIPRELFESEFFGHVRGAFTGAARDRIGRFELSHGGTLFLDEVGEIPLAEQAKLLRVIQEGEFERVGEDRTRRVDVRIVAATNRRLEREVEAGRFRKDLYFRLNVFPIDVPPLRARPEDVVPLAEYFIGLFAARCGRKRLVLSESDRQRLVRYAWPGNVRELASVVERSVILAKEGRLQICLPEASPTISTFPKALAVPEQAYQQQAVGSVASLRRLEVEMIEDALRHSGGRVSGKNGAAAQLGLNPSTLRDRIKALGVRRPS